MWGGVETTIRVLFFPHGMRILEPCAISTRVAPSFLRVGHVDLFARRAAAEVGENPRGELETW